MKRTIVTVTGALCLLSALSVCGGAPATQPAGYWVPQAEQLAELKAAPREDRYRMRQAKALLEQAGLTRIRTEPIFRQPGRYNVIATLPGETPEAILVGAHLDTTSGDGIIDDWSGVVMMTNLAQTLARQPKRRHTFVFIAFDLNEKGMIGSQFFLGQLPPQRRPLIKAVVNLECLGVSDLHVWRTGSADSLEAVAADVSKATSIPAIHYQLYAIATDTHTFMKAGIPAITFTSLAKKDLRLVTPANDRFESIDPEQYAKQYRFLVHYLRALDEKTERFAATNVDSALKRAKLSFSLMPNYQRTQDIVVGIVLPGSPEDRAGMEPGDRIVRFAGSAVNTPEDFEAELYVLSAGTRVEIDIDRDGEIISTTVQY